MDNYSEYYDNRNIKQEYYSDFNLPYYLVRELPLDKSKTILDIGCGFGMYLKGLKDLGYENVKGIDISEKAVNYCKSKGLDVNFSSILDFGKKNNSKYDFIIMSHVLEHIKKSEIIDTLFYIRKNLLNSSGKLCVMVPNAQSNTDCYWRYEDFTHHILFTSGSLIYVLKSAGYESIKFLDPKGIEGSSLIKKIIKLFFLSIYVSKKKFWNKITSSSYHEPSPAIFTFELKAVATFD